MFAQTVRIAPVIVAAFALGGCASSAGEASGEACSNLNLKLATTAVGTGAGAGIGYAIGKSPWAALAGAAIGGLAGLAAGYGLEQYECQQIAAAVTNAGGAPVGQKRETPVIDPDTGKKVGKVWTVADSPVEIAANGDQYQKQSFSYEKDGKVSTGSQTIVRKRGGNWTPA